MKINLDEVTVFLAVVDTGSLTAAAAQLGQPISTTSRLLARLEGKLQTTLLRRTTRRLALTDEGHGFAEDARRILAAVQTAEDGLMARKAHLSGPLHVDAVTPFMLHVLVKLLPGYRAQHPDVALVLSSNEGFIDLLERRVDLAIRIGELKDSSLRSRLLGHSRLRLLASPAYLVAHGMPQDAQALRQHQRLGFSQPATLNVWPLRQADGQALRIQPTVSASSGETLRHLALQGMGIVCLSDFMTALDVAAGRLVEVLPEATLPVTRPVHAVYHQQSAVSGKIASMVSHLAEAMRAPEKAWPSLAAARTADAGATRQTRKSPGG